MLIHWGNIAAGWALLLLPVLIGSLLLTQRWKRQRARAIGDPELVRELLRGYRPRRFLLRQIAALLAMVLLVLAWMDPRQPNGVVLSTPGRGVDMMVVLDLSKSMLATDEAPSRLDRAKLLVQNLLERFPGERVGLVVFAGHAYLQMPSTTDHAAARLFLAAAHPNQMPTQGTVISEALELAASSFPENQKKNRTIVLLSDGEDHDSEAESTAARLADQGMHLYTIGVGSATGTTLIEPASGLPKKDAEGNPVFTKMNPEALQGIAKSGKGKFFALQAGMESTLNALISELRQYAVSLSVNETDRQYRHFFPLLVGLALVFLALALFLPEQRKIAWTAVGLLFFPMVASAQESAPRFLYEGNQAFQAGKFAEAAKLYERANALKPSGTAQFNLGHAVYASGKKEQAAEAFGKSAGLPGTPAEQSASWYNQGVVLQESNQLDGCVEAYKKALRANPKDEDARFNLQRALEKKRQQQQQQQQNKPKNDKNKKDEQQKPQPQEPDKQPNQAPKPSPISKQQAEQQLKALQRQERQLQDKQKKQVGGNPQKPEKDW